jgi:two-component system, chemotaxis family, sensor histidine kinase and response regulator PixL
MMTDDLDFQESLDRYFEIEAAELLQTIEETLVSLVAEKTIERVHTLMRAAHTIKGSAANCGFKTIETIAHHLEDVFQALYPAELEIDSELGLLLMEGYDCLYDPLSALLAGVPYDEAATLERTAELFARLQTHLGDFFGRETPLPTAAELGFDVIGSIFTDSIPHDLEDLAVAIESQNLNRVTESLGSLAEFLLELGSSYSLPGIAAIANTTLAALQRHPTRVLELAPIALTNFKQAQIAIVTGDRSVGGEVLAELAAWTNISGDLPLESSSYIDDSADWLSLTEFTDSAQLEIADSAQSIDTSGSSDWLSLVNPEITDSQFVNIQPSPDIATESPLTEASDSSDWLSLVNPEPAATQLPESDIQLAEASDSSDWLSLVNPEPAATQLPEPNASVIVDFDPEIIEVTSFLDSETIVDNNIELPADRTEYLIETIESQSHLTGTLVPRSGVDRIFQSIALRNTTDLASEDPHQSELVPVKETQSADVLVSVRVATIQLERLSHTIGELLIDDTQQYLHAEQLQQLAQSIVEKYRRCEQRLRSIGDWTDKNALAGDRLKFSSRRFTNDIKHLNKRIKQTVNYDVQSHFDSLELDVYSDLSILVQNLTEELVELGLEIGNLAEMTQQSRVKLSKRKQLLKEAQSELFEARMIEISSVFNRFPRLLQQMVASHRKPAQLQIVGAEILIDKIIAEKLYDPLLHLIRNAYDHGVESTEIRAAQGKSATAQITIKAYHQGNRTKIEVSDDGQGLNWTKIRQRAIDLNLLSTNQTASEAELAEIMFAPGFSTADKVNDLSGRGIGLDVVRDRLNALQGKIDVRSKIGQGTTFVMQFPLNLTTTRLLICESAGSIHALRSESISQVLLPSPDRIQTQSLSADRSKSRFFRWGDGDEQKLIPIYSVASLLDYNCGIFANNAEIDLFPVKTQPHSTTLLLLEIDDEQICLEVNRILVEQELVVKSLGQTFKLANYIQGYSVLGNGSLTLAIDPVELLTRARVNSATTELTISSLPTLPTTTRAALAPASEPFSPNDITTKLEEIVDRASNSAGKQLQVLVVDDSLVQRQSLNRSLTKAGCQVILASHGREGILRLQEHPRIRLVVCDIEMPQMNGFEFLSYCRQDPKLAQIPIVMLTTRSGQKHRDLAMTLGAKDYLTKPQADRDLLAIIAKLDQPVGV